MRWMIAIASCLMLTLTAQARSEDQSGAQARALQTAIESVIADQINSFRMDDFDAAFTHAAPNIVTIFRTPENFGRMVRNGYPMVHRPSAVEFQDLEVIAGDHRQRVQLRDQSGAYFVAEYKMVQVDGRWKIAGVSILRAPGVGV